MCCRSSCCPLSLAFLLHDHHKLHILLLPAILSVPFVFLFTAIVSLLYTQSAGILSAVRTANITFIVLSETKGGER